MYNKRVEIKNPHLKEMKKDYLYHIALNSSQDLKQMFGDVKFVCTGGTPTRMGTFARLVKSELEIQSELIDISKSGHRYSMFKVGPVLSVSHGMGGPSISIVLHELMKLMYYAECKDPVFFRMGTCGGLGVEGGTLVVSNETINGLLEPYYELPILGKNVKRPAILNSELAEELTTLKEKNDDFDIVCGKTMTTDCFYEGQGRLDGAFCDYTQDDQLNFLNNLYDQGVRNIEMEAVTFAALTHEAGIMGGVVCVALLNRLKGDQILTPKDVMVEWQDRPQKILLRYIKKHYQSTNNCCGCKFRK